MKGNCFQILKREFGKYIPIDFEISDVKMKLLGFRIKPGNILFRNEDGIFAISHGYIVENKYLSTYVLNQDTKEWHNENWVTPDIDIILEARDIHKRICNNELKISKDVYFDDPEIICGHMKLLATVVDGVYSYKPPFLNKIYGTISNIDYCKIIDNSIDPAKLISSFK